MTTPRQRRTEVIPFFPLPLVIFPDEPLALHIFEERFKDLIGYCLGNTDDLQGARPFGISLTENHTIRPIGCEVRVDRILSRSANGEMDIVVVGMRRYEMVTTREEKSYPEIEVRYFSDTNSEATSHKRERAIAMHVRLVEMAKGRPPQMNYPEGLRTSYLLAQQAGLDVPQRQNLLEMRSEDARLDYLISYYERIIPALSERTEVKERIQANGYVRNFPGEPFK